MQLRDYQLTISEQANDLLRSFGIVYLAMQVRTGKTLTALSAADKYFESLPRCCGERFVLFITKKKAISSIENDAVLLRPNYELFIINYEGIGKLVDKDFDLIICDEAHCLGQFPQPAERTKQLKELCKGKPIIYLSGTPSPESYSQLFHQFWVSSFSPWKQYEKFYSWHKDYGIPAVKFLYNRQINDYSKTKKEAVLLDVQHLMISYSQEQAGFTSFVEEKIIMLPMPEKIGWAVKKLQKDKIITTKEGKVILGDTAVKEMQKVHQLCGGTVKVEEGEAIVIDMSKAEYIKEHFAGKKVAIFYKYVAEMAALKWVFNDRIITDPMEFNKAGNDVVFISQIQSGREGINLSTADCLIMYNIDFSAVSYWQARARLQTKDRKEDAIVYWLFFTGGIEEKIYKVVEGKKDFTLVHYKKGL